MGLPQLLHLHEQSLLFINVDLSVIISMDYDVLYLVLNLTVECDNE